MQDKSDLIRDRAASDQPYRTPDEIRSNHNHVHSPHSNTAASQRSNTSSHQTATVDSTEFDGPLVPLTIQIPKQLKAEIQRIAAQEDESDSATARAFLARGVQANIDMQYGAMIKPVIERAIHDNFQSYSNRSATIGLQAYYAAEQARILAIHILRFVTDLVESPDELLLIIKAAQEEAWKHMTTLNRQKGNGASTKEDHEAWPS